ncbi:MAG TPA: hypothetical protein VLB84_03950 [Bacteroidia bacterium]|nr:hypothetical protein [Bacteroidia bacterium]
MKKKNKRKAAPVMYVSAIDNIIYAMKDLRIFERFGFHLPPQQGVKVSQSQICVNMMNGFTTRSRMT